MKKQVIRTTACTLLLTLGFQLVFPVCSYALTTGPSQPEVQSFEPVGTTEMVDMFSGDFNYNIPLLDVDGYPVNIFYHSGVGIEQEASWVGLGWNINVGEINRSVRGLPDDFKGETIEKTLKIKPETDVRLGMGANLAFELFGYDKIKLGLGTGIYIGSNNYRGLCAGISIDPSLNLGHVNMGVGFSIGSQSGADIDFNASLRIGTIANTQLGGGLTTSVGTGFNSRHGLKDISLGMSATYTARVNNDTRVNGGTGFSSSIPIGLQNYVPVITNRVTQTSNMAQLKVGFSNFGALTGAYFSVTSSLSAFDQDGSRPGYGYLYAEEAGRDAILDFTRDKDGMYNKTMKNLPSSAMTYDIYSVSGQGTGGMFRPFRNDIGSIYDPLVSPYPLSENESDLMEFGAPNLFHGGMDINLMQTANTSGPWTGHTLPFGRDMPGSLYEKVFFKNGGELTYNQQQQAPQLFNRDAQYLAQDMQHLKGAYGGDAGLLPAKYNGDVSVFWNNTDIDRSSRATMISWQTAEQANIPDMAQSQQIKSYSDGTGGRFYDPKITAYDRYGKAKSASTNHPGNAQQISEFTQTMTDGRRYVYGIPAMNNLTREVTFAVDETKANMNTGCVAFTRGTDDSKNNTRGKDNYFSATHTPAYAHSFLLSSVLSNDYVDILGDGPTDDDPGTYVKFNYTMTDRDYRWRTPYSADSAQYNPGFWSDQTDGKGNYMVGSRQQWYVRTIESKNYIAEFHVSKRRDARGIESSVIPSGTTTALGTTKNGIDLTAAKATTDTSVSYKLDSICLYNKNDRYLNGNGATPVKTVIFQYNYTQCPGIPNTKGDATNNGKLTLASIRMRYGNSDKNLLSPYVFTYAATNLQYNFAAKDRWGNYKTPAAASPYNFEFPYTSQPDDPTAKATQDQQLSSWNLTGIRLPSGGNIQVNYESDDYAFVQDRRAMQMLLIEGVGASRVLDHKAQLYSDLTNVNNFVYFKRRKTQERSGLTLRENYLEGQDYLMYDFSLDIGAGQAKERVKGYAKIADVGICPGADDYAYIQLQKESFGDLGGLHPATVYGVNMGRYYLPQFMYPGSDPTGSDLGNILKGLIGAGNEMINMITGQNPMRTFVRQNKANDLDISKSWIRLQVPGLNKRGGGIRVKQLTLSDNWAAMAGTGASDASYGKTYDYTTTDSRYGQISSGVASYEPLIGGEENPFRRPVPYTADGGRLLPAVDFFQEEPYGEAFFPPATVGYSSVRVKSIHVAEGRSSQAVDEYLYYTAKDYPVSVDYTNKDVLKDGTHRTLLTTTQEAEVLQGYVIRLNDMHGKPKAVNNYVIHNDGSNTREEMITGIHYYYHTDASGKLDNTVNTLYRERGTINNYSLKPAVLGQDIDYAVDSRSRETATHSDNTALNVDVLQMGILIIGIPSIYKAYREQNNTFHSMVSTKIVQQYGILEASEQYDHGAKTRTDNLVYDGETGKPLLTRVNNQFNDRIFNTSLPAYMAYEGMRPAYTNTGYTEQADSFVINKEHEGFLYVNNSARFTPGDELLVTVHEGFTPRNFKLWVTGSGQNLSVPDPVYDSGMVMFWKSYGEPDEKNIKPYTTYANLRGQVFVTIYNEAGTTALESYTLVSLQPYGSLGRYGHPECGTAGCYTRTLLPGRYQYYAHCPESGWRKSDYFTVSAKNCLDIPLFKADFYGPPPTTGGGVGATGDDVPPPAVVSKSALRFNSDIRCGLTVAPRYKNLGAVLSGGGTADYSNTVWPVKRTAYTNVTVKVIRSGRRNELDKPVQQMTFTLPPADQPASAATLASLLSDVSTLLNWNQSLLSASATTYTDAAVMYAGFDNSTTTTLGSTYANFNDFVLGKRGTFRPLSSYVPLAQRNYKDDHTRTDGRYNLSQRIWTFTNAVADINLGSCYTNFNVLNLASPVNTASWKRSSTVTRYDIYGNALEEQDAIGNYTAAQYGYNKSLPVAVATNAQQGVFLFDGFEDYSPMAPQTAVQLFKKTDLYGTFVPALCDVMSSIIASYPSEQATGNNFSFSRNGQYYNIRNYAPSGATTSISTDYSHSGNYSLKNTAATNFDFSIGGTGSGNIGKLNPQPGKKYLLNFWVHSNGPALAGLFGVSINGGTAIPATAQTPSIDGWTQMEALVDLTSVGGGGTFRFSVNSVSGIASGVYIDDLRILPFDANMKSFVYEPVRYKLAAQLDENNMATFYEYDQEGLLIRTKKETERGIMTISESRRANNKQ